jgi:2-polyprenyl-3-methyl-5-hydroxy-6-metoxy-1,4-benzoquinol methylase
LSEPLERSGAEEYFEWRGVRPETYKGYRLPAYLAPWLPADHGAPIVDFGCGLGQMLGALRGMEYHNLVGVDVEPHALEACRAAGFEVLDNRTTGALERLKGKARLVIASHVIEHFPKPDVIPLLRALRALLAPGGSLFVAVPNAQSNTGSYWAYEDFTHHALFTSGSLYYVLRAAGFASVEFVDIDCVAGLSAGKRLARRALLSLYRARYWFWNRVTSSATHAASPDIFSYEIKAVARG